MLITFCVLCAGQDALTQSFTREQYPSINPSLATRKVVHIAFDQTLADNILWFSKQWIDDKILDDKNVSPKPSYSYNVGLLKNTGNFTYLRLPENEQRIVGLCLYTRIFQAVHKHVDRYVNVRYILLFSSSRLVDLRI